MELWNYEPPCCGVLSQIIMTIITMTNLCDGENSVRLLVAGWGSPFFRNNSVNTNNAVILKPNFGIRFRYENLMAEVNPRPAGPLDFPPPAGGGGAFERPPPMISAPGRRREKRKAAFESSRKIISKSFRSFFRSGQNCGLQGSKFQNFPKRFFDNKIFNFKDRATNLIPSCLSR